MMQINVKNVFNNVSQAMVFRKLCDVKGHLVNIILLPSYFMLFIFFYYQHGQHVEGVIIIESSLSMR